MSVAEYNAGFEKIMLEYSDMVTRICILHTGNSENAKDCYQNTFLKLYRNNPKFADNEHVKAWLIRVAINECNDFYRRNMRRCEVSINDVNAVWHDVSNDGIIAQVMSLDIIYREPLYLYYYEGYSVKEIAALISIGESNVKARLKRGREMLKVILGGDYDYEQ